jgi:L,D-transpeptidase ErfK/SrfK
MADDSRWSRRRLLGTGAAALAAAGLGAPALAQQANSTEMEGDVSSVVRHNISSFRAHDWRPYFSNLTNGAILCDLQSRALHFWSEDGGTYRLYPTSVPVNDELTRLGRTQVTDKIVNPPWRPTPSMRQRNPDWPEFVPGGDPMNPLGPYALYLSWQYYRIHGTHDTRKIGRRSSNGCIGLYNEHIAELFGFAKVGTQVLLI